MTSPEIIGSIFFDLQKGSIAKQDIFIIKEGPKGLGSVVCIETTHAQAKGSEINVDVFLLFSLLTDPTIVWLNPELNPQYNPGLWQQIWQILI